MFAKPDNLGTAHWLDPNYAGQKYSYVDGSPMTFLGRNPVNHAQPMGFQSDNHIFLCAGSRAMKGRSLIINNLAKWPGSVVAVDPKGENATNCAERRGKGNEFCEGMGQDVYVLDPLGCAKVPDEYRAYFNPLDVIDPEDDDLMNTCSEMALSMCLISESGGESADWVKAGADFIGMVIAHVKTSPEIADEDRNLATVARYCRGGNVKQVWAALEHNERELENAEKEGREPDLVKIPDSVNEMLWEIARNKAFDGMIAETAISYLELRKKGDRHFASILQSAFRETKFLSSRSMKAQVSGNGAIQRTFNINDLKDSEKGVSVFLCLPENKFESSGRWEKLMVSLILNSMQKRQGLPRTGVKLLMCLDEFLSLGKVEPILKGMNSIAGAGVQMMICVTNINGMERLYGKTWQEFLSGCTLQIYFKIDDLVGREFLEKMLGETEVSKFGRSRTNTINEQDTVGMGYGFSETNTHGTSHSDTKNYSTAKTHTDGENWNVSRGTAKTRNKGTSYSLNNSLSYGEASGTSAGEGYGPHLFFRPWTHTSQTGTNKTRNSGEQTSRGSAHNTGESFTRNRQTSSGGNSADSVTQNQGGGTTDTTTNSHADTKSTNFNFSKAQGRSQADGLGEVFHKRSLLTTNEIDQYLAVVDEDRGHAAYPGLALVKISGIAPMLVRKCYYDDDPIYHRCFNPNPEYEYIPWYMKPLLGCEYTEDHYLMLRLPDALVGKPIMVRPMFADGRAFSKGEAILSYKLDGGENEWVVATDGGTVIEFVPDHARLESGEIALLRFETPLTEEERLAMERGLLRPLWERIEADEKLAAKKRADEKAAEELKEKRAKDASDAIRLTVWREYAAQCLDWQSEKLVSLFYRVPLCAGTCAGIACGVISLLAYMLGYDFYYQGRLPVLCYIFGPIAFCIGLWKAIRVVIDQGETIKAKRYTLQREHGPCPSSVECPKI